MIFVQQRIEKSREIDPDVKQLTAQLNLNCPHLSEWLIHYVWILTWIGYPQIYGITYLIFKNINSNLISLN